LVWGGAPLWALTATTSRWRSISFYALLEQPREAFPHGKVRWVRRRAATGYGLPALFTHGQTADPLHPAPPAWSIFLPGARPESAAPECMAPDAALGPAPALTTTGPFLHKFQVAGCIAKPASWAAPLIHGEPPARLQGGPLLPCPSFPAPRTRAAPDVHGEAQRCRAWCAITS
jgi:hypothetical protein